MDKISGIIKGSPRVQTVDMRESGPIRPGTPAFGRAEGVSSLAATGANNMEATKQASQAALEVSDWRAKDQRQAALAADVTNKFFLRPTADEDGPSVPAREMHLPAVRASNFDRPSQPAGFKTDETGFFRAASAAPISSQMSRMTSMGHHDEMEMPILTQPEGLYPKGSFIDRTA